MMNYQLEWRILIGQPKLLCVCMVYAVCECECVVVYVWVWGCCVDFNSLYALEDMLERIVSISTLNLIQCPELESPKD